MALMQVGHYRLDTLLGFGGMGEVYKAYDTQRERYVALKLLPAAVSGDSEYVSRFKRESNVVARLRDPHIIPIHDFGEIDGRLFIDMRLVDGTDLGSLIRANGPVEPLHAAYLVGQVAEALDSAHADHLVHRDIKPSNILVTASDFVYVIDFGITRAMSSKQTALTVTGATIGTLNYMAPERFTGQDVDGRADVYSLACVLHECLTGELPFGNRDVPSLIYAHLYSSSPRASSLVEGIPPALDEVIAKGMAKDPGDRFPTAGQLAAAVREALQTGAAASPATEPRGGAWAGIPASAWVTATENWQRAGQPDAEDKPGAPADPEPEPAADLPAPGAEGSHTQTVIQDNFGGFVATRPRQNVPPGISPEPQLNPDPDPDGEPPAEPGQRRRGVALLAALAVAAVAIVLIAVAVVKPHASNQPPVASTSSGPRTGAATAASSAPAVVPKVPLPTVAGTVQVGQDPSYVEVAPNGKYAYITDTGANAITVLNTVTNQVSNIIPIPEGPPQFVSFSNDGRTAYVSVYTTNGSVHLIAFIDTANGKVTGTVPVTNHTPGPSQISPNGRYLYVPNHNSMTMSGAMPAMSGPGQDDIDVINVVTKKLLDPITVAPNPHWIALGQNGLFYVTNHTSGMITIINSNTNQVVKKFVVGPTPHAIAISPDFSRLAVTSFGANEVFIISTATDKVIATIQVGREPLDIEYSIDGRYLYDTNCDDNTVSVIDTATDKVIGTIKTGKQPTSFDQLPNGRQGYVSDEGSGSVEILNLPQ
jgi:YVTN family beta-propeller protein